VTANTELSMVVASPDAAAELAHMLDPLGQLFGAAPVHAPGGMVRLADPWGASIALAAPFPGERGCRGAVHLHADRSRLQDAATFSRFVRTMHHRSDDLRRLMGTNPRCRRLGPLPQGLVDRVSRADFGEMSWTEARGCLRGVDLSKWLDVNLRNVVYDIPGKPTVEWRILPACLDERPILAAWALFSAILSQARRGHESLDGPVSAWLDELTLTPDVRARWS
jgi:hypothetical protein